MMTAAKVFCMTIWTVILMAHAPAAQAGNYVPYEKGDFAVFEDDLFNTETTMEVDQVSSGWHLLNQLPGWGQIWVWTSPYNEYVYVWSSELSAYQLLANFNAPVGSTYRVEVSPCNRGAVVLAGRNLTLQTPAGLFEQVVRLDFRTSCTDGGVTSMWFAPQVGIVRVAELNIAGERTHDLVEARVGKKVYPLSSGIEVNTQFPPPTVFINRQPSFSPDGQPTFAAVKLVITNKTPGPLKYLFLDGQRFDIFVINAAGEVVSSWSRDRHFTQSTSTEILEADQTWKFQGRVPLTDDEGNDLDPGVYTLGIEMTSSPVVDSAHAPGAERIGSTAPLRIEWAK